MIGIQQLSWLDRRCREIFQSMIIFLKELWDLAAAARTEWSFDRLRLVSVRLFCVHCRQIETTFGGLSIMTEPADPGFTVDNEMANVA